jgi:hypothetical protein
MITRPATLNFGQHRLLSLKSYPESVNQLKKNLKKNLKNPEKAQFLYEKFVQQSANNYYEKDEQ